MSSSEIISSDIISSLYHKEILGTTIFVKPKDINKNINKVIQKNLQDKVEGICIKEGFIKPESTRVISKTEGKMNIATFNGNIKYNIKYEAEVCNPMEDQIIDCIVADNNKSIISAYVEDQDNSPLSIILARQHHIGNKEFINLKNGDEIRVKIISKLFEFRDKQILVVCQFLQKNN